MQKVINIKFFYPIYLQKISVLVTDYLHLRNSLGKFEVCSITNHNNLRHLPGALKAYVSEEILNWHCLSLKANISQEN